MWFSWIFGNEPNERRILVGDKKIHASIAAQEFAD